MSGRHGTAADGGAVGADSPAPLLPGLELFIQSWLVGVESFVHVLGECLVYHGCSGHPVLWFDVSW